MQNPNMPMQNGNTMQQFQMQQFQMQPMQMQNPNLPQMRNPHVPQMHNPHAPQMQNPHGSQTQFYTMPRPQGQMNPMMQQGKPANAGFQKPTTIDKQWATRNSYDKTQEASFSEMSRNGNLPECLYCDKKFATAGSIRVHLRSHSGFRPYKCSLCNYRHWYKTPMLNSHFVNVHGRKGVITDVVTDIEEENKLIAQIEEEANEVRANQRWVHDGHPKKEKKIPDREGGAVFHEYYLGKYDDGQIPPTSEISEEKSNSSKTLPLSAKLSEAYNNNRNSPNLNGTRTPGSNPNNVYDTSNRSFNDEPANVPSELKELSIDKLLNNDF